MENFKLNVPVCFCIFNRPDTTEKVFEEIRKAQPPKLYLVSDAPREGRPEEAEKVAQTRGYVESHIDWPCEVHKNYAEANMGCKKRMASGITWAVSQEECMIILEDDCVPAPDFFPYIQTMLEMYKDDNRVMMVSGTNLQRRVKLAGEYDFTRFPVIWGWATWRRAWETYDVDMADWPEVRADKRLRKYYNPLSYYIFRRDANKIHGGLVDTWDLQWDYCRMMAGGLGIVPKDNLICNIGFNRADATHTGDDSFEDFTTGEFKLPVSKREPVTNPAYDREYQRRHMGVRRLINYVRKKVRRLFKK